MAEYIDKEQLLSDLYSKQDDENLDMMLEIANFPAADVAQVVHGKWIPLWVDDEDKLFREAPSDYKCSACKVIVPAKQAIHENYCHICGAKMDGDR